MLQADLSAVSAHAAHAEMVAQLRRNIGATELIETHLSSLLIAGEQVYKLKKPLRFGFVDFSTLAARRAAVSVWARHLDGRLSGGHHDAHGNCEGPTALARADRHRASAVVHAPASSALAMRSRDSEPARRSTAAQRLGGEPVVSVLRWQVSRDAGAARRFCC